LTPSRGLTAALVVSLALVAGCSSSEGASTAPEEKPSAESTWVGVPSTSAGAETEEDGGDADDQDAPADEEDVAGDPTDAEFEEGEDGKAGEAVRPRRAPHSVAVHFQNGLFNGDTEVCDLLSDEARADLVRTKVAEGAVAKGSSCQKYVRTLGRTYEDWDVTVEAKIVTETPEKAVVRVDMVLDDDVANTRMELAPVDDTWEITDWGQH